MDHLEQRVWDVIINSETDVDGSGADIIHLRCYDGYHARGDLVE